MVETENIAPGKGIIRVGGVPEHFNYPWRATIDRSEYASAFSWTDQPGGTGEMLAAFAARELDMASILTEGALAAIEDGLPVTILQTYVDSPLQWGVFVPGGLASSLSAEGEVHESPRDPAQLFQTKPKPRFAISRFGSGSHLMAFLLARDHNVALSEEQFVVVGDLSGAVDAFAADHCDIFLWEQHMASSLVESGDFRQIGVQDTPWPSFVIAVRDEVLQSRTTEVGELVDSVVAEAAEMDTANLSPELVQKISETYGLSEQMTLSWSESTRYAPRGSFDAGLASKILSILSDAGFTGLAEKGTGNG